MSEKLKELMPKKSKRVRVVTSNGMGADTLEVFTREQMVKFGESVILECCNIVNQRTQYNNPHDCLTVLEIKEHFGIGTS